MKEDLNWGARKHSQYVGLGIIRAAALFFLSVKRR